MSAKIVGLNEELTIENVLENFQSLINSWCEKQHLTTHRPRYEMSQLAVKKFSNTFSAPYIRKHIDSKYKMQFRANNAKKSWIKSRVSKITKSISNLEDGLPKAIFDANEFDRSKK